MTLHCDSCEKELGDYLYGKGGIEERAKIFNTHFKSRLPDIVCNECWSEGYSEKNRKKDFKFLPQGGLEKEVCGKCEGLLGCVNCQG